MSTKKRDIEDIYPLSPLQEGMLFHSLLDADSGVYVLQDRYRLRGAIDPEAFLNAWRQVVDAHPILRSSFVWNTGRKPLQIVHRRVETPGTFHDLRGLALEAREREIEAYFRADAEQTRDLSRAPLIRFRLLATGEREFEFLRTFHHALLDAWSVALVTLDFVRAYEASQAGRVHRIAPGRPYRDFVQFCERRDRASASAFFRAALAPLTSPTPLPSERDLRAGRYERPVMVEDVSAWLDHGDSDRARTFAREHGLTLNTLFQAAWAVVLARYSGQPEVAFGVTVAGRPSELAGVESIVGLFINTLPLCVRVDGAAPRLGWLEDLQSYNVKLRDFEHTPLSEITPLATFGAEQALFDSILVFENAPIDPQLFNERLCFTFEGAEHGVHTHYGLTVVIMPEQQLRIRLSYDCKRFERAAMQRLVEQIAGVLRQLLERPEAPLSEIELITPEERAQLAAWNATDHAFPLDRGYAALFWDRVQQTPERVVARCLGASCTYAELWQRSGCVAAELLARGVTRDALVVLHAPRSLELLAMMIGVLRARAAFIALEVSQPAQRLSELTRLSNAQIGLYAGDLPPIESSARWLDIAALVSAAPARDVPLPAADASDLAYVVFTSGSTGVPKGAMIEQRGMLNNIFGKLPALGLHADDRIAQTASCAFDIAIWQLLAAPILGAQLEIFPDRITHDPAALAQALERAEITIAELVPAVIRSLLDAAGERTFPKLRWLLPTGEALPAALCQAFGQRFAHVALMNAYGPAECSDDVAMYRVPREFVEGQVVPLGTPTANNRLYIVDERLQLMPIGAVGEIVVAGAGVGRGYLGDPEKTATSFVDAPWLEREGRVYRTGDRGRVRADGVFEFVGRADDQVKLRGHRIELGELERRLGRAEGVSDAAAVLVLDARQEPQLVAYCETAGEASEVLRAWLAKHVPSYMLPAAIVCLPELPRTANGKLDRAALRARGLPELVASERVEPQGETERALHEIWSEVLANGSGFGARDDFFRLGGHSLLAIQVNSRIQVRLGAELPLRALFEHPTIAELARAVDEARTAPAAARAAAIERRPRPERVPLSFAQRRLWFLEALQERPGLFHVPFALRMRGVLDVRALAHCFRALIRRHELLRTSVRCERGEPYQVVCEDAAFELPVAEAQPADVSAELAELEQQGFDFARPPLLRARLLRIGEREHVLLVVLHHLISDAWSATLVLRELSELYRARVSGTTPRLAELPIQYADYALFQHSPAARARTTEQLEVLLERLRAPEQEPFVLDLPADRPRPPVQSYRSGSLLRSLDAACSAQLQETARALRTSPFAIAFAGFAALLHRLTGRRRLWIGTPASNRQRAETEGLIGPLLNNWVIPTELAPETTFAEFGRAVSNALLDAQSTADVPFEELVDRLRLPRSASHAPLFQVMVAQQLPMERGFGLSGLDLEVLPSALSSSEHDLDLHVVSEPDGAIALELLYSQDLFERASAERLFERFELLLRSWFAAPERAVSSAELLTAAELASLRAWNATEHPFALERGYAALLEERVRQTPSRVVARCGAAELSYAELWRRSGCVAAELRARGVTRDVIVVLHGERDLSLLAMMVGVLRARGAFLALDPSQPAERLAELVRLSGAAIVLHAGQRCELGSELAHVAAEPLWAAGRDASLERLLSDPSDLAYVVFTSGSTGVPKGVMVEQRGMLNNMLGKLPALEIAESDRIAQTASCAFDISIWQLLAAPILGARLEIFGDAVARDPRALVAELARAEITIAELVPAMIRAVLDAAGGLQLPHLRWLLPTGEAVPAALCSAFQARFRHVRLMNAYGPAECSDDVAMYEISPGCDHGELAPLGRPTANNRLYVVDERLQLLPTGVTGEIVVAGAGVGRGYLGDAQRTAASFVEAPWLDREPRVYRTGDLGRLRADGVLEFIGRRDEQVKVRGHRIELGEIESRLRRAPGVCDAAVLLLRDARQEPQLIAYCETVEQDGAALRDWLAARVPSYMVPAWIVCVPALPRTENGKLDRANLRARGCPALAANEQEPPADALELQLAAAFAEVLQIPADTIGRGRGFFELGGHSLLATVLLSRVQERLSAPLVLRDLFEHASVAALAERVRQLGARARQTIAVAERPARLPLSAAQQRLWFLSQLSPDSAEYNLASALRLRGVLDDSALEAALCALVERHEILRSRVLQDDAGPYLTLDPIDSCQPVLGRSSIAPLSSDAWQAKMRVLAAAHARRPFDLAREHAFRAELVQREGHADALLMLTFHHCVSDDWSTQLLIEELSELYRAQVERRRPELAPLRLQYVDWSIWSRTDAQLAREEQQLGYWRNQLGGGDYVLKLPAREVSPGMPDWTHASQRRFELPGALAAALRDHARVHGVTPFTVLLAATQLLLSTYSNQRDVRVGTPVANRQQLETHGLLGCFVNTLVLRSDVDPELNFAAFVRAVNAQLLAAQEHQDVPFERVVEALVRERDLTRSPLFQVLVVMQNTRLEPGAWPGLQIEELDFEPPAAQFDLCLEFHDDGEHIACLFEYRTVAFQPELIERMAAAWLDMLQRSLQEPALPLLQVSQLPAAERAQLEAWNRTAAEFPLERGYAGLLREQVELAPERVVARCAGEALTFAELWRRSGRVAAELQALGVGRDAIVVLHAERGLPLLAMMVGVLRARAAFLALEVSQPAQRLAELVALSGAEIVLFAGPRPALPGALEAPLWWSAGQDTGPEPSPSAPGDLAYVVFTSGSTGVPKGVMVEQRGMLNNIFGKLPALGVGGADVIAQTASCAFDISIWQLLAAPILGARVEIFADVITRDPAALLAELERAEITIAELVPAVMRAILDVACSEQLPRLRWLLPTGEASPSELCQAFSARFGHVRLMNAYGPAECSDDVAMYEVPRAGHADGALVPIGRPTSNNRLYVVNPQLQLAPLGVTGEIVVAGSGVGRGYLRDPERTAASFVDAPWLDPEPRVYRTGDLGRWRTDGVLEFVGRNDEQVKVRGHRIELGEIEARLRRAPNVRDAAVVVARDARQEPQLVGYCEAAADSGEVVKAWLAGQVPSYMLPAWIVCVSALPRTDNGKLDRAELRARGCPVSGEGELELPANELELQLAAAFAEVLRVPPGSIDRRLGFFELGGHSLLATVLLSRLQRQLGAAVALRDLFEHASVAALAQHLGQAAAAPQPGLTARVRPQRLPLSAAQERLWFLSQLTPDSAQYNITSALVLRGRLDVPALEAALQDVVCRHEILRSRIVHDGAGAQLIIDAVAAAPVHIARRRIVQPSARAWRDEMRELASVEAGRSFDLAHDRLFRLSLFERSTHDEALLVLTLHHCIGDDWSTQLLIDELSEGYSARLARRAPVLPALPIQYVDYSLWSQSPEQRALQETQLHYWRDRLESGDYLLQLPRRTATAEPEDWARASRKRLVLPAALAQQVRACAREHAATPFVVLLSATKLLLGAYSNQRDIRVGIPVANRRAAETQALLGCFVNTLVLRSELDPALAFGAFVRQVHLQLLAAQEHQDVPFERVVNALVRERDTTRTPLFQVLVVMQNAALEDERWPGLTIEELDFQPPAAQFDLNIELHDDGQSLACAFEYRCAAFEAELIERMLRCWLRLLEETTRAPHTKLAQLSWLEPEERASLARWNSSAYDFSATPSTLTAAMRAQLERTPDRVAVRFGETALTYAELHARARCLAQTLREAGVGRESIVGVCMERSTELVVALVAILEAGAAYLPLDTELPPARIAYVLEDAGAKLVLSQRRFVANLPAQLDLRCLDGGVAAAPPMAAGPCEVEPSRLAYVIYTSGSTGKPKGVLSEHRALMNRLAWMQHEFPIGSDDRVLQKTPYSFDVSVWEFFWPLITGAELVMAEPDLHRDSRRLCEFVRSARITCLHFVPSMLRAFLEEPELPACGDLRRVFASGEALPAELVQRFAGRHTAELVNLYGPTEAAIDVSYYRCPRGETPKIVPIGRPVANTQLHILDDLQRPLPIGVTGELCIGGVQVARGYLNRPELNAERFIADPARPGERLYRTGDLCRYLADGSIEYLGRSDGQVKLRGLRIELSEISSVLAGQSAVRDATVVLSHALATPQLVAYVVMHDDQAFDADLLRAQLRAQLPEHMVPSHILALSEFPTTAHGKLDLRALPVPAPPAAPSAAEPANEREQWLCELIAALLKLPRVSPHDNFFALGGDSILAMQLVARGREQGLCFTPRQLYDHPTAAALAKFAASAERTSAEHGRLTGELPLLPIQSWFFAQQLAEEAHWNQSALLIARQPIDARALRSALEQVVDHHDALRLRFERNETGVRQWYASAQERTFGFEHAQAENTEAQLQILERHAASFDLRRGPLITAALIERSGAAQALYVAAHHLVIDALSFRILLVDLMHGYDAARRGEPSRLPAKTSSYRQWAERLQRELAPAPQRGPIRALPVPHPEHENVVADELRLTATLTRPETRALLDTATKAARASVEELLISALSCTLRTWAGDGKAVIDLEGHGRDARFADLDVSRTVGWFTTLYPVELDVPAAADLSDRVRTVKQQLRAASEHSRRHATTAGSAVLFNYLGTLDEADDDAGWAVSREPTPDDRGARNTRSHELEVVVSIASGQLEIAWHVSARRCDADEQRRLLDDFRAQLRAIIEHFQTERTVAASVTDFPLAKGLTPDALAKLLKRANTKTR